MFSNSNQPKNSYQQSNYNQYKQNTNQQKSDQSPYSPQTKPFTLPLNSYKSYVSGSPQTLPNYQSQQTQTQLVKLTQLIQPQNQIVSSNQGTLHFHDQAANVLQRYPNNDIGFVGIWGAESSDKSFFYDKILNLCDIQGNKYSEAVNSLGDNIQLFFYERPFIKDNKIRFFLIDSKGYKNGNKLTKIEKGQLDIMLSICQVIILIQDNNKENSNSDNSSDILDIGYKHLNQSLSTLHIDKKNKQRNKQQNKQQQKQLQVCWPKSLFILYNTPSSIKKHKKSKQIQQQLCKMFKDYNFSILHNTKKTSQQQIKSYTTIKDNPDQLYLKNTSSIFRQIYNKIQYKNYMNIKYNGITCPHILAQSIYTINQHNNLYLPRAFNKAKRSIYYSLYNRYILSYLLKIKPFFKQQKPYSTQYMLNSFKQVNDQILKQYYQMQNQICVNPNQDSLCLQYQKKLQEYIEEKQKNIINVNNKKSNKYLNNLLKSGVNPLDQLKKVQNSINGSYNGNNGNNGNNGQNGQGGQNNVRSFDYNAQSIFVGNSLKQIYSRNLLRNNQNRVTNYAVQQIPQPQPEQQQKQQSHYQQQQEQQQDKQALKAQQLYHQQLKRKKLLLQQRRQQLQRLSSIPQVSNQQTTKQLNKYKQQQKQIQQMIKQQQQKIMQLNKNKSQIQMKKNNKLGSGLGGDRSAQFLLSQVEQQLKKLRQQVVEKQQHKKRLESQLVLQKQPQIQMLQSKLMAKKQQIQQVKKSGIGINIQRPVIAGGPGAQKRVISARNANIKRVHASRI